MNYYYITKSSAGSWSELPVTGKSITWAQGDTQSRNAADYRLLMASGMFDAGDVDPVFAVSNPITGVVEKLQVADQSIPLPIAHRRYYFAGCAGDQIVDDPAFADISGTGNNAIRGANLSAAQLWANAGYATVIDPVGGLTDSVLRIPALNYDYNGGESLLIFWLGQATPEGADVTIMGTSGMSSTSGIRVRCKSTGQVDFALYEASTVQQFSGASSNDVAGKPFVTGELHAFALWINGQTRQHAIWVDGLVNVTLRDFGTKQAINTLTSNTFNIGAGSAAPGGTEGIASKTRALHILRFSALDSLPSVGDMTTAIKQLRVTPGRLILSGAR